MKLGKLLAQGAIVLKLAFNTTIAVAVAVGWCFVLRTWLLERALKKAAPRDRVGPWGTVAAWDISDDPKIVDMRRRSRRSRLFFGLSFAVAGIIFLGGHFAFGPAVVSHPQANVIPKEKIEAALRCLPANAVVAYSLLAAPVLLLIALVSAALAQRHRLPQRRALFPETLQLASYGERGIGHLRRAGVFGFLAAASVIVPVIAYFAFRSCFA